MGPLRVYKEALPFIVTISSEVQGLDPIPWLENLNNICLKEYDNLSLFEFESPGVYSGHYFFNSARGRSAKDLAEKMLEEMFSGIYADVRIIKGLTPTRKAGARWMNKQLGFKSYGVIETCVEPCELVILTKEEWLERSSKLGEACE